MNKIIEEFNSNVQIIGKVLFKNLGINLRNLNPDTLTFCSSLTFLNLCIKTKEITAIITDKKCYESLLNQGKQFKGKGIIIVSNPKEFFFKFHNFLCETEFYNIKEFKTNVGENCEIGKQASISSKNVKIGKNVIIEDFVRINKNVIIKDNVRIQSGAVIGNDCLQCLHTGDNLIDIVHIGGVIIGENVKIESNSLVCKDIFNGNTIIGNSTKIGGLVHVSHGCIIGKRSILTANILLGGGCMIGDDVFIGPNVTTSPLIKIENNARLTIGSVVTKDIKDGEHVTGNFAIEHEKFIANLKKIR